MREKSSTKISASPVDTLPLSPLRYLLTISLVGASILLVPDLSPPLEPASWVSGDEEWPVFIITSNMYHSI